MCFSCNMDLLLRKIPPMGGGGGGGVWGVVFGKLCRHSYGNFSYICISIQE